MRTLWALLPAFAITCVAVTASAAPITIFDNGSFSGVQVARNNGCTSFNDAGNGCQDTFTVYDNFVLASRSTITGIEWHQTEVDSENYLSTVLTIFAGVPSDATLLHTVTVTADRILAPSSVPGTENEALASASGLNIDLGAGSYWLGIHNEWGISGGSQWSQTIGTAMTIPGRAQGESTNCGRGIIGPGGGCLVFHPDEDSAFRLISEVPKLVTIDIKPGDDTNCFARNGRGVIPVAILGNSDFDVTNINTQALRFDSCDLRVRSNPGAHCSLDDVNDDGMLDLICEFWDSVAKAWLLGDGEGTVAGELNDGTQFQGTDSMCVVPKSAEHKSTEH